MNIITKNERKIHSADFNPKIFYGTMSDKEKSERQARKYYVKYKYLEVQNKHRKTILVTFTSKNKCINTIQEIKKKFLGFLKSDKTIKNNYSYIWAIETGHKQNNPHIHFMIWYDDTSLERITLHYQKTLKKFNLVKKWSQLTKYNNPGPYVLKDFSLTNKHLVEHYLARRNISRKQNKQIRFIGFSSFKQTEKVYKKSYNLYRYTYLNTDKLINFGSLILWDKKYLVKKSELDILIIYLLLKYKNPTQKDMSYLCLNSQYINLFFTLSIKINKTIQRGREWEFPIVFIFP